MNEFLIGLEINYWAVLVAAISTMVVGSVWYAKGVFGGAWMHMMKFSENDAEMKKGMMKAYGVMLLGAFVKAYIFAYFIQFFAPEGGIGGAVLGLWIWLGFVGTSMLAGFLWEKRPFKLYLINSGHMLVELLVMGGILGAWQ